MLQEDAPAHDSASAAAAELVAEEEQAAAKAAAKKAKKQRQKLKAKKQAQPEPSASAAESLDAHTPSDEAQPLSPESSQLMLDLPELSSSSGQHQAQRSHQHQAQGSQTHDVKQQQQQQHEAGGTSFSASSALGGAAAQENDAKDVAVEPEALHLPSCEQAANRGHTDAGFLQQLFCCPLTKVSHVIAIPDRQAFICTTAAVQQQRNAWLAGSQHQRRLS